MFGKRRVENAVRGMQWALTPKKEKGKCCKDAPAWIWRPFFYMKSELYDNVPIAQDFTGKIVDIPVGSMQDLKSHVVMPINPESGSTDLGEPKKLLRPIIFSHGVLSHPTDYTAMA